MGRPYLLYVFSISILERFIDTSLLRDFCVYRPVCFGVCVCISKGRGWNLPFSGGNCLSTMYGCVAGLCFDGCAD